MRRRPRAVAPSASRPGQALDRRRPPDCGPDRDPRTGSALGRVPLSFGVEDYPGLGVIGVQN
jgi:hypothetical protein